MKFFVEYNGKYMAIYKSIKPCLKFINLKGWKDDENNILRIVDEEYNEYSTITGVLI